MSAEIVASRFRFAVNILPKDGILDPQGRAVEQSLPHLGLAGIGEVRVGRRVELAVDAPDAAAARALVEELARELLCNPMIEQFAIEPLGAISAARSGSGG
jgi:phosphoribosylformylglycinamidine synthase PurS subunit